MKNRSIDNILAESLDAIRSGELTLEACLNKFPEHREELAPLLEIALRLESSPMVTPRPSFQRAARARILGQISASRPATLAERIQGLFQSFHQSFISSPAMILIVVIIIAASLLTGGVAYASDGAVPGDTLYTVDRAVEAVRLGLIANPSAQAKYQFSLASERLHEAETLSARGDAEHLDIAMRDYGRAISQISHSIGAARSAKQPDLNALFDEALAEQESQLKRVFSNLAAPEIEGDLSAPVDQDAMPSLSFEPDELELLGCAGAFQFIGYLENTGDVPGDVAANVVLGYQVIKGGEFVDLVELSPFYWETIGAGEQVEFTVNVALIDDISNFAEEAEVKIRVFIASESNRPDHHVTRLTLTIVSSCVAGADPTSSISPTVTLTPTATLMPTDTLAPTMSSTPKFSDTPPVLSESIVITDNNKVLTVNCNGEAVELHGNKNTLTLLGTCSSLTVSGNANVINLENSTTVTDTGNENIITVDGAPSATPQPQLSPTALLPTSTPPVETPPAGTGPIVISDNNKVLTVNCNGGAVEVSGNKNTLTLLGTCSSLTVSGNANVITLEKPTTVTDTGNENIIQ